MCSTEETVHPNNENSVTIYSPRSSNHFNWTFFSMKEEKIRYFEELYWLLFSMQWQWMGTKTAKLLKGHQNIIKSIIKYDFSTIYYIFWKSYDGFVCRTDQNFHHYSLNIFTSTPPNSSWKKQQFINESFFWVKTF